MFLHGIFCVISFNKRAACVALIMAVTVDVPKFACSGEQSKLRQLTTTSPYSGQSP